MVLLNFKNHWTICFGSIGRDTRCYVSFEKGQTQRLKGGLQELWEGGTAALDMWFTWALRKGYRSARQVVYCLLELWEGGTAALDRRFTGALRRGYRSADRMFTGALRRGYSNSGHEVYMSFEKRETQRWTVGFHPLREVGTAHELREGGNAALNMLVRWA